MTTPGYVFDSAGEAERLQVQAEVWSGDVEAMLDEIGIGAGATCVDVACGPAGILEPLSRRVGATGKVVAVDRTPHLLEAAREHCRKHGLENVEFVLADARKTTLPRGSFDFVHSRFLLLLFEDYGDFLTEMIELARPGGVICCQESDQAAWDYFPTPPSWPGVKDVIERAFATFGGDPNIGRRLVHIMRERGLDDVRARAAVRALQGGHPYMQMPLILLSRMHDTILEHGLLGPEEFDAAFAEMQAAVDDPATWEITFALTQIWGRRPIAA
ncbi:class I SAM-dependent methyltransferase [Actinomadura sp. KC216]|uniref:class I SAM-dependent methyltransferase n=1 Tax=Actinomadura sp. KC216 TaxID=2530370 RepID=UPI00105279DC|nr:class I SAM-dependent methyltransferase [Actinomadura sp. KC216]TDB90683.1 class I SAM-dependent methyltransferase [Actinomadura sp. KC216]